MLTIGVLSFSVLIIYQLDRAVQAMVSKAEQMKAEQGAQMSLLLSMVIDKW